MLLANTGKGSLSLGGWKDPRSYGVMSTITYHPYRNLSAYLEGRYGKMDEKIDYGMEGGLKVNW